MLGGQMTTQLFCVAAGKVRLTEHRIPPLCKPVRRELGPLQGVQPWDVLATIRARLDNELPQSFDTVAPVGDRRCWPSIAAHHTVFDHFRVALRQHRMAVGVSLSQIHREICGWFKSIVKSSRVLGCVRSLLSADHSMRHAGGQLAT